MLNFLVVFGQGVKGVILFLKPTHFLVLLQVRFQELISICKKFKKKYSKSKIAEGQQ